MSEEMESATITLESVGESGDKLHALNCGGDLAGVVEMFTRALQVEVSGEGDINATLNVSHPYLQDRYFYNIGLQALLKTKRHELAKGILQRGVIDREVEFGADTIHIFIRDAFRRGAPSEAVDYFETYFDDNNWSGKRPLRSTMSVNMMVEGFRSAGSFEKAREYANLLEAFDLQADSYTFSSLVRMTNTSTEIWNLLDLAESSNQTSIPFLRCCVESFGKVGCPGDALKAYTQYLAPNLEESADESRRSGDVLLAALLNYKGVGKTVDGGVKAGYVALALATLLNDTDREGALLLRKMPANLPSIKWGTRGYNVLFTYIGSMDGSSRSPVKPKQRALLSEEQSSKLRLGVRNQLRLLVLSDMDAALEAFSARNNSSSSPRLQKSSLLPNGRVCDALLRSFSDDIEVGRAVWKKSLLPLARRMEKQTPGAFLEITEKCFVALMFGCGRSSRPDIGMEIARAARKSKWSPEEIDKLAVAYSQGCRLARSQQDISAFSLKKILDKSMEESLRIELGLVGDEIKEGPRIRIQFG